MKRVAWSIMSFISKATFCLEHSWHRTLSVRANFLGLYVSSSSHSIGESGLDLWTGVQRSQHDDGSDGGAGEFRGDIRCDSGEAQYVDIEHLSGATRLLEVLAAIIPQAEI